MSDHNNPISNPLYATDLTQHLEWFEVLAEIPNGMIVPVDVRNCHSEECAENYKKAIAWWLDDEDTE